MFPTFTRALIEEVRHKWRGRIMCRRTAPNAPWALWRENLAALPPLLYWSGGKSEE
jgi:hypothetical protein